MLSKAQIDQFWRDGYLVAPDAVTPAELAAMRAQIAEWVEESRAHRAPFGTAHAGRPAALRHGRGASAGEAGAAPGQQSLGYRAGLRRGGLERSAWSTWSPI